MKNFKKCGVLVLAFLMCTLLVTSVWATNSIDVTYEANDVSVCVSDQAQTVTVTVKANKAVAMDSLDAEVSVQDGITLKSIKNDALGFDETNASVKNGTIKWISPVAENVTTNLLAEIEVTVPANTPAGSYEVNFNIITISSDWGMDVWEDGAVVSATITVKDHKWGSYNFTDNKNGTHTANRVCENDANHVEVYSPVAHSYNKGECLCGNQCTHVGTTLTYTKNDETHTATCTCGVKFAPAAHEYEDGFCVCGKEEPAPAGLKGDIDLDGDIDMDDVVVLMRHVLSDVIITDSVALENGEVTNDTALNMDDVVKLMRYVLSDIDSLD